MLADHLAALLDAAGSLPAGRPLEELRANPDLREDFEGAVTTVMLPAIVKTGRPVRVNVSFDEHTLKTIDSAAADRRPSRSAFLVEAARQVMGV